MLRGGPRHRPGQNRGRPGRRNGDLHRLSPGPVRGQVRHYPADLHRGRHPRLRADGPDPGHPSVRQNRGRDRSGHSPGPGNRGRRRPQWPSAQRGRRHAGGSGRSRPPGGRGRRRPPRAVGGSPKGRGKTAGLHLPGQASEQARLPLPQ